MRLDRWLFALAACLTLIGAGRDEFDAWVDATALPPLAIETAPEVRDRDGDLLRAYQVGDGRWRLDVTQDGVDARFIAMLLAYEDKRFYHHAGVDLRAVVRAAVTSVAQGRLTSGASTLTMQVARLLEEGPTGEISGKLRQIRVALALERRLSKAEILAHYLHRAPYGGNVEGVRAATLTWFGKEPARLTPAQSALLVALPQSPETRRPDRHADAARTARARVLARMASAGVLDAETARAALREPIPTARRPFPAHAPHLADRLITANPGARHITTLHRPTQVAIESLARQAVRGQEQRLSIAIVVADHQTGAVLAHVGSPDYDNTRRQGFVDMTQALRSPGSTLKPLVYAMAFDQGLAHPETLIDDVPMAFGSYAPQNFDAQFRGTLPLRRALQLSLNLPVVQLTQAIGPARLLADMRRSGMRAELPGGKPGLALALGGVGVTLEGMVQLYAAIARGGSGVALHMVPGQGGPTANLIAPEAAWHVGDILADLAPPPGAPRRAIAYKTGTSYGHRDTWALGWDGQHVIGVWMGRPDGTPVPGAFGGDQAAPVLFQAFGRVAPQRVPLPPPPPATLMVASADLLAPLRHFNNRARAFAPDPDAPHIAFPPSGARVSLNGGPLVVKLRAGRPPFTILADGRPVIRRLSGREAWIDAPGTGFVSLSVIDGLGRSARTDVRLD
ncbi:penicillin-binding protein 1C [Oceaniglobus ichthyenteri]|uniref:penicillin-binding protein 1C n=1 Tax=Oceaniglobus ichthyenteri TaxID=2136177 RepID=UPI000D391243|nr:penicillin-binding protein 1C [Oceaniglobus ichthyenteri]